MPTTLVQSVPVSGLDQIDRDLLSVLNSFAYEVSRWGISVQVLSPSWREVLSSAPVEKKRAVRDFFQRYCDWLSEIDSIQPLSEVDAGLLNKALNFFGLTASSEFLRTIGDEDIVEIYGPDMKQLYVSLNFFKICGYSLIDLSFHEWFVLWGRPSAVIEKMAWYGEKVLKENVPILKMEIPTHPVREIYNANNTEPFLPKTKLATFRNIASLTSFESGNPIAIICSSTGELLPVIDGELKIEFI